MHIKHVELKNFRGFREVSIDLDPRLVVLAGPNGCGKTSFLRALWVVIVLLRNVEINARMVQLSPSFMWPMFERRIDSRGDFGVLLDCNVKKGLFRVGFNLNDLDIGGSLVLEGLSDGFKGLEDYESSVSSSYAPLFLFVEARRTLNRLNGVDDTFVQRGGIHVSSIEPVNDFSSLLSWFKDVEDVENERRLRDDPKYRDRGLQAVRDAITQAVPGFDGDTLFYRRREETFVIRKGVQELSFAQLSAGEQMFIVMVGDIARRLALASPGLEDPLVGEGIILLDEIEQHLHPSWQREAIRRLPKIFPNCQFIVATHSPAILSEVRPESIIALSPGEDGITARHPDVSYGLDVNAILEDVMGVTSRPVEVKDKIEALLRHIESGERLEEAREELGALERMIGAEDRELVFARALLRRKEVLGR